MYGIYANIGGILMVNVTIYIAYMDPMGDLSIFILTPNKLDLGSLKLIFQYASVSQWEIHCLGNLQGLCFFNVLGVP